MSFIAKLFGIKKGDEVKLTPMTIKQTYKEAASVPIEEPKSTPVPKKRKYTKRKRPSKVENHDVTVPTMHAAIVMDTSCCSSRSSKSSSSSHDYDSSSSSSSSSSSDSY